MTTYELTGLTLYFDRNADIEVGIKQNTELQVDVPTGTTSFFYSVAPLDPYNPWSDEKKIEFQSDIDSVFIDGNQVLGSGFSTSIVSIHEVFWTASDGGLRSTVIMDFEEQGVFVAPYGFVDVLHVFQLGGDALPEFDTLDEFRNFFNESLISMEVPDASSPFAPNTDIPFESVGILNELITGDDTDNDLDGSAGNDTILGLDGDDWLVGYAGDDSLEGGEGSDSLYGGAGDDYLNPGDNTYYDYVVPGTGNDTVDFTDITSLNGFAEIGMQDLDTGVTATLNAATNTGIIDKGANGTTTILGLNNPLIAGEDGGTGLYATLHDDTINFTTGPDGYFQIYALAGNDTINLTGDGGTHVRISSAWWNMSSGMVADLGTGIISNDGHGGSDTITGVEHVSSFRASMMDDSVIGSDGRDQIILMAGNDTADGGDGFDLLRYDRTGVEAVNVNLETGIATGIWRGEAFTHQISNFEEVRGSREGSDTIIGNDAVDEHLEGSGGNDSISGGGGSDVLYGGSGADSLDGGSAKDHLHGGNGQDVLHGGIGFDRLTGGGGNDRLFGEGGRDFAQGGLGHDMIRGGIGNDRLLGQGGNDRIYGGSGDDVLNGNVGTDRLFGGAGNDKVFGGVGDDKLFGGGGNDSVSGGSGNDSLYGGAGEDTLNGGTGNDTLRGDSQTDVFVFSEGEDQVLDFGAEDLIDLSGVAGIEDFDDLLADHLSGGPEAVIDDGLGNTLTLIGVDESALAADNFLF